LFVSDNSNNTGQFVTPAGAVSLLAGVAGHQGSTDGSYSSALFRQPGAISLDKQENLYVADAYRVLRISGGKIVSIAGLAAPGGMAIDSAGNIYVSAPSSHRADGHTAAKNLAIGDQIGPDVPQRLDAAERLPLLASIRFETPESLAYGPTTHTETTSPKIYSKY